MKKGSHYFRLLTKKEQQVIIRDTGSDDLFLFNELDYKSFEEYAWCVYNNTSNVDFYLDLILKYN